jgi:hypothetical protein
LGKVEELVGRNTVKTVVHGELEHPRSGDGGVAVEGGGGGGVAVGILVVLGEGVLGWRVLVVVDGREEGGVAGD